MGPRLCMCDVSQSDCFHRSSERGKVNKNSGNMNKLATKNDTLGEQISQSMPNRQIPTKLIGPEIKVSSNLTHST